LSKEYESIKIEKTVYKRLVYIKEVMQERLDDAELKERATMSTVINASLRELEIWIENKYGEE